MTDLYINSKYIGTVEVADQFVEDIKDLRRKGDISTDLNVYHNLEADEVHVFSNEGRARRPLIVVKEGKSLLT